MVITQATRIPALARLHPGYELLLCRGLEGSHTGCAPASGDAAFTTLDYAPRPRA
jgi:hypothetical protein